MNIHSALSPRVQSHEQVSTRLHQRFQAWLDVWRRDHVSEEQDAMNCRWLMGDGLEDLWPCTTRCEPQILHYQPVNRYRVSYSSTP